MTTTRSETYAAAKAAFPYAVHVVARHGEDVKIVRAGVAFSPEDGLLSVFDLGCTGTRVTLNLEDLSEPLYANTSNVPNEALEVKNYLHKGLRYVSVTVRYADAEGKVIYRPVVEFRFRPLSPKASKNFPHT